MRLLLMAALLAAPAALAETIPFDSEAWTLQNGQVVEHLGRQALTGSAFLADIQFENGVIEFEVAVDGSRSYPGISFRASSPLSYEHLYLRPHAGLRSDGLQYAPAFGPGSDWQLYHGPGFTSSVAMPAGRWIPLRLEVLGRRARVFYDGGEVPTLLIDRLQQEPVAGAIGIRSAPGPSAYFSNFRVTRTDDLDFPPRVEPLRPRGLIGKWEISQALSYAEHGSLDYPGDELLDLLEWSEVEAEPGGLLNFSRLTGRDPAGAPQQIYARLTLRADEDEIRPFSFGYSDYVSVFLNGRRLFTGDNAFQSRGPSFAGLISLGDQLYLPLEAGDNELLFCVIESFGGWGLKAQDNADDFQHAALEEAWKLESGLKFPESAVWDAERGCFYVSMNFNGGREFVARVSPGGEFLAREWATGLSRPTGMAVSGDRLWVVERPGLAVIDLDSGEVVERHAVEGAGFLNDVCLDEQGRAYVSDSRAGRILRLADGAFETWLDGLTQPNGILMGDGEIIFGAGPEGCVRAASLADKSIREIACIGAGANLDGLAAIGKGGIIASDYNGRVIRVGKGGQSTLLLDRTASGEPTADLCYARGPGLLVIPSLNGNSLTAYRID